MAGQLMQTALEFNDAGIPLSFQYGVGCGIIVLARNKLVNKFLKHTTCQKLLFLDSDIIATAEDIVKLYHWSQKYPVVGACYPVRKDPAKFFINVKANNRFEQNEDGLMEVAGFGAGFLLIDRSVFEKMSGVVPSFLDDRDGEMHEYFDNRIIKGHFKGEDISFMKRWIEDCYGKVWLDPYINLKHVGMKEYNYKLMDYLDNKLEKL